MQSIYDPYSGKLLSEPIHLVIATPIGDRPVPEYTASMIDLILMFAQVPLDKARKQMLTYLDPIRSPNISGNRERLVKTALERETMTDLLFVDADMEFSPAALYTLFGRGQDFIGANYPFRRPHPEFLAVGQDGKRVWSGAGTSGLQEVDYSGLGFCLIKRAVLEAVPQPRFYTMWNSKQELHTDEDYAFYKGVQKAGFKTYVDHDASKMIGHVGSHSYTWREAIREEDEI